MRSTKNTALYKIISKTGSKTSIVYTRQQTLVQMGSEKQSKQTKTKNKHEN